MRPIAKSALLAVAVLALSALWPAACRADGKEGLFLLGVSGAAGDVRNVGVAVTYAHPEITLTGAFGTDLSDDETVWHAAAIRRLFAGSPGGGLGREFGILVGAFRSLGSKGWKVRPGVGVVFGAISPEGLLPWKGFGLRFSGVILHDGEDQLRADLDLLQF